MESAAFIAPASDDAISQAAERLRLGQLVAFPTETVYGLGADATNEAAVASIFEAKQRPSFNPLICHFASVDAVEQMFSLGPACRRIVDVFWPGSLSVVLPRSRECPIAALASAGLDTVAVRVPDHPVARTLLERVGTPIAAPSANRSGRLSPTRAGDVLRSLAAVDLMVVDGGPCAVGVESSVIEIDQEGAVILLREGGISREELRAQCGVDVSVARESDDVRSPGMLLRHYEPAKPLRLNATNARPGELYLGFGPLPEECPEGSETLSINSDLREAASNLFKHLHTMEMRECSAIAVAPIPDEGLGRAINDRLKRGASASDGAG